MNRRLILRIFTTALITLSLPNCKGKSLTSLDQEMSTALRNIPYDSKAFHLINIYETANDSFLSSKTISKLAPVAVLGTQDEINEFLRIMSDGRTISSDPALKDFHYRPVCYHIVAFNSKLDTYGYLKCQISSDIGKPIVARIQIPDGTNSFEYRKLVPMFIEEAKKRNIEKLKGVTRK